MYVIARDIPEDNTLDVTKDRSYTLHNVEYDDRGNVDSGIIYDDNDSPCFILIGPEFKCAFLLTESGYGYWELVID